VGGDQGGKFSADVDARAVALLRDTAAAELAQLPPPPPPARADYCGRDGRGGGDSAAARRRLELAWRYVTR
jgi:hypothetical protein